MQRQTDRKKERKKVKYFKNFHTKNGESFSYENLENFKNILLSNDSSTNGMKWIEWNHLKVKYF